MKTVFKLFFLYAGLLTIAGYAFGDEFPQVPQTSVTPGKLCDRPAKFRYPENIAYCERDVLFETLNLPRNNPHKIGRRLCDIKTFRDKVRGSKIITSNIKQKGIPQGTSISALLSNMGLVINLLMC